MAENTGIEWTEHTFNGWWGCSRVDADCRNCYADSEAKRRGKKAWGTKAPRYLTGPAYWRKPLKWNEAGKARGRRVSVFAFSMADVFEPDNGQPVLTWGGEPAGITLTEARTTFFDLVERTPWVLWLVLTKRPENVLAAVPESWRRNWPANVALGTSCGHARALYRLSELCKVRRLVDCKTFCSFEPLTEPIKIPNDAGAWLDWAIIGGESGPKARLSDIKFMASLARTFTDQEIAAFVKQIGAKPFYEGSGGLRFKLPCAWTVKDQRTFLHPKDKKGADPSEWPRGLRVREFPKWFEEVPVEPVMEGTA